MEYYARYCEIVDNVYRTAAEVRVVLRTRGEPEVNPKGQTIRFGRVFMALFFRKRFFRINNNKELKVKKGFMALNLCSGAAVLVDK